MKKFQGRAFVFGDNVDTDQLAPGLYIKRSIDVLAQHCLDSLAPGFATQVRPGDFVVAGRNFGMGSSREQAAEVLHYLGIRVILARSYGGIFYRNAINLGLLPMICGEVSGTETGDNLHIDIVSGEVFNLTKNRSFLAEPMPEHLSNITSAGGLLPYLEQRLGRAQA